ncbi:metallophosphoesterase family protein [Rosistilla oblonga]|uniref:metallophosphoesterase family protein n=1 Tax=Rosistilla oblonga TaxID=2527990 RepID=UPI003A976029
MVDRRQFIGSIPVSAMAISAIALARPAAAQDAAAEDSPSDSLIASPPVVQNPRGDSFGVSIAVDQLATAWVEYGLDRDDLKFTAIASQHGLVSADDRALHVRVQHDQPFPVGQPIFYRVVVQPLAYKNAYVLQRGEPQATDVYALRLPDPGAKRVRVVSINDTHENLETIRQLHAQIEALDPDLLIWNGDTCNDFDASDQPAQIMLNPAKDRSMSWASTRPLVFSNGNHDVRGQRARETIDCFVGCPESSELPYNQALRIGPLALVTMDTGEDKPDRHPVFAGTAAYEPYRSRQATWLQQAVNQTEVRDAPFKIVACHIPLRGLPGQNDGTTLEGYASFSGFGAKLWLPTLVESGFQAVLSGHMHRDRLDSATEEMPVLQFVGGGPTAEKATLTIIDAEQNAADPSMEIRITDLGGKVLHQQTWNGKR